MTGYVLCPRRREPIRFNLHKLTRKMSDILARGKGKNAIFYLVFDRFLAARSRLHVM